MNDFAKALSGLPTSEDNPPPPKFEFQGDDLVKKSYELGKYLELIPDISFDQYCTEGETLAHHQISSLKDSDLKPEKLIEILSQHLEDLAHNHKRAFTVDWKWTISDVMHNTASIVPDFKLKLESENYLDSEDTWEGTFSINDNTEQKTFKKTDIHKLINYINDALTRAGSNTNLYRLENFSDSHTYLLLDKSKLRDARVSEFLNI